MNRPPRDRLTEAEKDALLEEQAALIERMAARIAELEAALAQPKKTSSNSHTPPSQDGPGRRNRKRETSRRRKPRPSRPGVCRPLTEEPDKAEGGELSALRGGCLRGAAVLPSPLRSPRSAADPPGGDADRAVRRP